MKLIFDRLKINVDNSVRLYFVINIVLVSTLIKVIKIKSTQKLLQNDCSLYLCCTYIASNNNCITIVLWPCTTASQPNFIPCF